MTMELPRTSRRIGLNGGALQAMVNAPLYRTMPVCSRASIGLGYASALILAGRYDDTVAVLSDPVIAEDAQAAQWRQFVSAAMYHRPHLWPDVVSVTGVRPPAKATYVADEVIAVAQALKAVATPSLGEFHPALYRPRRPDRPS